jgi:hypothetical protein
MGALVQKNLAVGDTKTAKACADSLSIEEIDARPVKIIIGPARVQDAPGSREPRR